jgi:hypothetical protein
MAVTAFNGGETWYPFPPRYPTWTFDVTSFQINASGEVAVLVTRMPVAGTIDKLATIVAAVANAPDNGLRFSLQGVGAAGLQDGTIKQATNAFATVASGSVATGWLESGAFAANYTVTRNELLALVLDIPTFTAGDDLIIRGMAHGGLNVSNIPYSIRATNTLSATVFPIIVAHYTDNGGFWQSLTPIIFPSTANPTPVTLDTGTTPDEIGAVFIPSHTCRLNRITFPVGSDAAGSDFDIIVYDSADGVLDTASYDGDQLAATAGGVTFQMDHLLTAPVTLTAGSTYRIILKPTTTANVRTTYLSVPDAAIGALPGKLANFYLTERTNAGAWTNYNTAGTYRYPTIALGFDALGAGGAVRVIGGDDQASSAAMLSPLAMLSPAWWRWRRMLKKGRT